MSCQGPDQVARYLSVEGQTMGTTYHITYLDSLNRDLQPKIDSLLIAVNLSMSTYMDSSLISQFNQLQDTSLWFDIDHHFAIVYATSIMVHLESDKAFDPTIMPLVRAWGFSGSEGVALDSATVGSLKGLVDFLSIQFAPITIRKGSQRLEEREEEEHRIKKTRPEVELDFSAIAKGYGVDAVGALLDNFGVEHYMVEIGGEVRAKGKNDKGGYWRLGINRPVEDVQEQQQKQAIITLKDQAMATSGNYRNYKVIDGQKVVHTINPITGYPEISNTLSVSVVAEDCARADAYATAFMVLGYEKGLEIVESKKQLEAFFIYSDEQGVLQTVASSGLMEQLQVLNAR